jgi:hypothetical protein
VAAVECRHDQCRFPSHCRGADRGLPSGCRDGRERAADQHRQDEQPADRSSAPMQRHSPRRSKTDLHDQQKHPCGEERTVDVEQQRKRGGWKDAFQVLRASETGEDRECRGHGHAHEEPITTTRVWEGGAERPADCGCGFHRHAGDNRRGRLRESIAGGLIDPSLFVP